MKHLTIILLTLLFPIVTQAATWTSKAIGKSINYTVKKASSPAKSKDGKQMTVVYLENLAVEKIGKNTNATDVKWLNDNGYNVVELDYNHDTKAVAPNLNDDIIEINVALNSGTFCGLTNISADRAYVLFEGYRIERNVSYYLDDPTVYNYPDGYSTTKGDSLYMDIIYPANSSVRVPVVLSFAYSNSYHGNEHKRMFLGYTFKMFSDSVLEGLPGIGMAWAIADHPKYCDWGNGKFTGGANKSLGSIEVNPDAAKKVRSAVRTLREYGKGMNLNNDVAVYGFSRGSTAASLLIGDAPKEEWLTEDRGRFPEQSADIQAAILGPGVFDFSKLPTSQREYVNMTQYAGAYSASNAKWAIQGATCAIMDKACPCFLFYNTDDDAYYDGQMKNLISILESKNVNYELLKNFASGHSVPSKKEDLTRVYAFLKDNLLPAVPNGIKKIKVKKKSASNDTCTLPDGMTMPADKAMPNGIVIANGRKYIKRSR